MAESTAQLIAVVAGVCVVSALVLLGIVLHRVWQFVDRTHARNDDQLRQFGDRMLAINDDCREAARDSRGQPEAKPPAPPRINDEDRMMSVAHFPPDNGTGDPSNYSTPR